MIEPIKHTVGTAVSGLGLFGAVTLTQVSLIASIVCALVGTVAGLCTINSWWRGLHKDDYGDS